MDSSITTGKGNKGSVSGGSKVPFKSSVIKQYAEEIATDEIKHVKLLRGALGSATLARPALNIGSAFTAAAQAAGIIGKDDTFSPVSCFLILLPATPVAHARPQYASDDNFLLGAFLFEDTGDESSSVGSSAAPG